MFEPKVSSKQSRDAVAVVRVGTVVIEFWIFGCVNQLANAEQCGSRHSKLFLDVRQVIPVMPVVPVVERERQRVAHILLFSSRRRVHRYGRLIPHPDDAEDVPRHVEGMSNRGRDQTIPAAAFQSLLGFMVVPVMDPVMMRSRMIRLFGENLADHQFRAVTIAAHAPECKQNTSFHVLRVLDTERFKQVLCFVI